MINNNLKSRKNKSQTLGGLAELRAGAPFTACWGSLAWQESIAEGGDKRVGLHFCPFLRALGQTITMLDHYVNYPEKTKIVTEAALSTQ